METLKRLVRNQDGATAVEYGLIAALISVGLLLGLESFGAGLDDVLTYISDTIEAA
ncbi:pilin [Sinorhizobium glycinis]|uniref:Pilin n=1 Tax=Sinorhizobium glycinis TaxID=1472378 RepID=A0A178Y831_9HYPH|nr:Flp family type IVb pilin [Sinorhizobium glycinis]OAP43514.1 pilin [Sinorhizobium glycinis]